MTSTTIARVFGTAISAGVFAAAVALAPSSTLAQPYGAYGPGMMGGGMGPGMMGGYANRPVGPDWQGGVLNYAQTQAYLRDSGRLGHADPKSDTVTYSGSEVTIDMTAVQPGHDDQTFEVAGLTNPTLVIPQGATVHLNLVNMDYGDNMEHAIILTPAPPPYPYMSMMYTGPGLAQVAPFLPWRSEKDALHARYAALSATFVARDAGTYWYVCPTPGHASKGMYGKFVVR